MKNNIISAEFSHFRHIKTRKVVVLECEIAEELFQDAIAKLGMPIGGESKPVAIALLNKEVLKVSNPTDLKTEGEKLRTRAIMLCKDKLFQEYAAILPEYASEYAAIMHLKNECDIESRSELAHNIEAQTKFKELLAKYEAWKLEQQYSDNLERV